MRKLLLGLLFIGSASTTLWSQQPSSPSKVASSPSKAPSAPYEDYRIEPGDTIEVLYRNSPEFNQTVFVQPGGSVTLELIGSVPVKGLTLAEAKERIMREAGKRLNEPELSLALKDFDKPHFTVMGEVANPGRYELRGSLSAIDGLAMAGGFKQTSKHTQILLIHRMDNVIGETQLIDYRALEKPQAKGKELIALKPGDLIIVPQSKLSKVERYVKIVNTGVYYNPVSP
jgi:polysaccharide export outer membrane protein